MNHPPQPPTWIDRFLRWRLPAAQFEEVQGDMHELYGHWVAQVGKRKAALLYLLNAFAFLRPCPSRPDPSGKRKRTPTKPFHRYVGSLLPARLANLQALPGLLPHQPDGPDLGAHLRAAHLPVGSDELRVDKFHQNDRRLYAIMSNTEAPSGIQTDGRTPSPLAEALLAELPEVNTPPP
jgi:hypothetical protein